MDKDKLITQLKEQNKLLRAECKAAELALETARAFLENETPGVSTRLWKKYLNTRDLWQTAKDARLATEPPF